MRYPMRIFPARFYQALIRLFSGYGLTRLWPIGWIERSVRSRMDLTIVLGRPMWIDPKDTVVSRYLVRDGIWEPVETRFIIKTLKKNDTVLDIGAHIGYYTVLAAQAVGLKGKVIAFEPGPENFTLLKKNIELNCHMNTQCVQKSVSDKNQTVDLFLNPKNKGDHRMYAFEEQGSKISIQSITLDDFFCERELKINFMKIDVQGVEWRVFEGAKRFLNENPAITILMEFWPDGILMSGGDPEELLQNLRNWGFEFYKLNKEGDPIQLGYNRILSETNVQSGKYLNLVLRRYSSI